MEALGLEGEDLARAAHPPIRLSEELPASGLLEEGDHEPQQAQDRLTFAVRLRLEISPRPGSLAVPVLFLVSTSTPPKSEEKRTWS